MKNDLEQIKSEIPKGVFWLSGSFLRRILDAIIRERRFASLNGGITEQPTKDGYALALSSSSGDLTEICTVLNLATGEVTAKKLKHRAIDLGVYDGPAE